jgi:acetate---CoA ligase (ADP-forming)
VFGRGGVLLELAPRVAGRRLPLGPDGARRLVEEAAAVGLRGQTPWEVAPLAAAVEAVAELWRRTGSWLESADLNPVLVTPGGPVAVDALLIAAGK